MDALKRYKDIVPWKSKIQFWYFHLAIVQYGLRYQLQKDHGEEFVLCIFVQDLLKGYKENIQKKTLDGDNVYAEQCYRTVQAGT